MSNSAPPARRVKNSSGGFRGGLLALAFVVGCYWVASAAAEIGPAEPKAFPTELAKSASSDPKEVPDWLGRLSPFRSDLESNYALVVALQAVQSGKLARPGDRLTPDGEAALARVRRAVSSAPYRADLWLALALLQARRDPHDPTMAEALKMAYFTAPNESWLMPVRLNIVTEYDALGDPDLKELARGDIRLMITRQPDMKPAVVSAYRRASNLGKAFLEEAVQSTDPSFSKGLRG